MATDNPYAPSADASRKAEGHVEFANQSGNVPTGTVAEILEWVDGDKEKAKAALAQEEVSNTARKSLVAALNNILHEDK